MGKVQKAAENLYQGSNILLVGALLALCLVQKTIIFSLIFFFNLTSIIFSLI